MNEMTKWIGKTLVFMLAWMTLSGCHAQGRADPVPPTEWKTLSLAIAGYNYTNRYIDSFEINGAGGGNLFVSSPTSGGGGTVCCALYMPGLPELKVTVRWQNGGCVYHAKSRISDEVFERVHHFFKETKVPVDDAGGANPRYLEVHFYPDGSVRAAATREESPPRLKLSKQREDKSPYPPCPDDREPAD